VSRAPTVGLVGCGHWGVHILRDLRTLGCSVVVVAREGASTARAEAGGATAIVPTVEALPDVDGVVVATPSGTHVSVIDRLLTRHVPIFVEKPLAPDASAVEYLANKADGRVFEMHKWRYHPGVEALGEIARNGDLGRVVGLQMARTSWGDGPDDVDPVWHLAPHDLSIALEVLGMVPQPRFAVAQMDGPCMVGIIGVLGTDPWCAIDTNTRAPAKRREVTLYCADGAARLADGYAETLVIRRGPPIGVDAADAEHMPISSELPLLRELRAFVEHLRGGRAPRSSITESLAIARAVEELRARARYGAEAVDRSQP
jgi:predicted dehydrogenase